MSNYPGFPLPFSTWDTFTPSLRHPFPVGSFQFPGLTPSVHALTDPVFRTPLLDPLSSVSATPSFSPGLPRYLYSSGDIPALGLEPLYGFRPQEPPSLLLSPNLTFSQNPSPLTFDQIYRSGASSVSPVSQYRSHLDDRGLSPRFAVPGRFSDPVRREHLFSVKPAEAREKQALQKQQFSDKDISSEKSVKIWKPFEVESDKETKSEVKSQSKLESPFSIESLTREENKNKTEQAVDANGNNVGEVVSEKVKHWPEKPIPLRPVPVFSVNGSGSRDASEIKSSSDKAKALCSNSVSEYSVDLNNIHVCADNGEEIVRSDDINVCENKVETASKLDLNTDTKKTTPVGDICAVETGYSLEKTKSETKTPESEPADSKAKDNSFQGQSISSDSSVPYVQKKQEKLRKELQVSLPKLEIKIPQSNNSNSKSETGIGSRQDDICSPTSHVKSSKTLSPCKGKTSKKDELLQLSIQVNEVRNRRNSKDSKLLSPILSSPRARHNSNTSDNVLSPPIEVVSKSKTNSSKVGERRRLSLPIIGRSSRPVRHLARMTSTEGAITMLKHTEDSLSASISSSHLSESDSDTQLSTDNAEKLFTESQTLNTQQSYSSSPGSNAGYTSTLGVDSMNHDNQYYKPNTPQLCQNESDNQKPYHCVQGQMFHDKQPEVLPPFNCYSTNQSPNVLPREPGFHSQEENSNFPPSLSGVDSSMDYDESSVMSDSSQFRPPRCDSQSSISHGADSMSCKDPMLQNNPNVPNQESYHDEGTWDFLHSKQYIENIYGNQLGCEIVKSGPEELRESDSPKTFIDLDKTTKEKKAQETSKDKMKDGFGQKHFGKSSMRPGYPVHRHGPGMYGNQPYDNYAQMAGNRWSNFNRGDGMMGNQPRPQADSYPSAYDQQNQYRNNYQSNYPNMNQNQNGNDKPFNNQPPGYHGNEYNQNDYYNQNPQMKNYQGNYGNARYDNGFYQSRGGNEFNSQSNTYQQTPGEMQGPRFPSQGYSGNQSNYNQHYGQQTQAHCGPDNPAQYQESPGFNIPRNASPASTGSDFGTMEAPGVVPKKKRGRKRKVEKEPPDENKPRPTTMVMAPTKIGPLIDVDNPESTIDTYDYNNQIETIFNFNIEDDLSPIGAQYLRIEQALCQKLLPIKYGYPVTVIYSPLTYAFQTHRDFVAKFCTSERTLLFLGMNPGPYGMSQNGVSLGLFSIC